MAFLSDKTLAPPSKESDMVTVINDCSMYNDKGYTPHCACVFITATRNSTAVGAVQGRQSNIEPFHYSTIPPFHYSIPPFHIPPNLDTQYYGGKGSPTLVKD